MNKNEMAQKLGISRPTLNKYLKKAGLNTKKKFNQSDYKVIENFVKPITTAKKMSNFQGETKQSIKEYQTQYIKFPGSEDDSQVMELEKLYNKYQSEIDMFDAELRAFKEKFKTYVIQTENREQREHKAFLMRLKLEDKQLQIIKVYSGMKIEKSDEQNELVKLLKGRKR